jgi:hypothetical protein
MQSQNVALERDMVSWQDSSSKKMGGAETGCIVEKGHFFERRCVGETGHDKVIVEKWSGPGNEVSVAERGSIRGKSSSEVRSGGIGCDGAGGFPICLFALCKKYLYITRQFSCPPSSVPFAM